MQGRTEITPQATADAGFGGQRYGGEQVRVMLQMFGDGKSSREMASQVGEYCESSLRRISSVELIVSWLTAVDEVCMTAD